MKRSPITRLLPFIMALVLGACANGDENSATCNEDNCKGCCKGTLCITDTDKSSCGADGEQCEVCDSDQTCSSSGSCVSGNAECDSDTPCKTGCCKNKKCYSGKINAACGDDGEDCVSCSAKDQTCDTKKRECTDEECKPNCVGKCEGADDGCGDKCEEGDCKGCCKEGKCITKTTDAACGKDGGECVECECEDGECKECTKDCDGKCKGASDGCGGKCEEGDCEGCCNEDKECEDGDEDKICGGGGNDCKDCTEDSETCDDHACSGCEPNCDNKCEGEPDGCKGTCTSNTCTGCCTTAGKCVSPATKTACGKGGEDCEVCKDDYDGWSWKCDTSAGECVHDQQLGTSCSGKTGGTTSCTDNNVDGKCWEDACCTGCWDADNNYCWHIFWDDDCGKEGEECEDCAADDKVCRDGDCTNPTGNSCDTDWASCEDIGGLPGTCVEGKCCTGCYYFDWSVWRCQDFYTDDNCGIDGEMCEECDTDWGYCEDGDCFYPF